MIAFAKDNPEELTREDIYALRRILVGRLQQSSRGIPRRERVEQLRQFSDEWTAFQEEGRLPLLRRALALGPAVASEAGDLWRKSLLLGLASQVDWSGKAEPAPARVARPEPALAVEIHRCRGERERKDQGDLFLADLVAAPVCS